jgi:hypothetical protein
MIVGTYAVYESGDDHVAAILEISSAAACSRVNKGQF